MNITDPRFKYTNAADSSKPGYLQAKFDAIRKQQAAQKPPAAVLPITTSKRK